jgi:hypothetical protein
MVVSLKTTVFWDMASCSLVYRYQCHGGTWCLHLQGRKLLVGVINSIAMEAEKAQQEP